MDRIEAKEYLESLKKIKRSAYTKADELAELNAIATSCTVNTDKDCIQTSGESDKFSQIIGNILDVEKQIRLLKILYQRRLNTVYRVLEIFNDKRLEEFVIARYLDERNIYDVAIMLGVSDSTAKRLQRSAIIEFAKGMNALGKDSILKADTTYCGLKRKK